MELMMGNTVYFQGSDAWMCAQDVLEFFQNEQNLSEFRESENY